MVAKPQVTVVGSIVAGVTIIVLICVGYFFTIPIICDRLLNQSHRLRASEQPHQNEAYKQRWPTGHVVVTLATSLARQWQTHLAVDSLLHQTLNVTCVIVILNGFDAVPSHWKENERVAYYMAPTDLGAAGNFFDSSFLGRFKYHLTADDDISYPDNYVERVVEQIIVHGGKSIVGINCRSLNLLRVGALNWFNITSPGDPQKRQTPELQLPPATMSLVFSAFTYMEDKYIHNYLDAFEGGTTDLIGMTVAGYATEMFDWSRQDLPPGLLFDYDAATAAKKKGLSLYCMRRDSSWLMEVPALAHRTSAYATLLDRSSSTEDVLLAAMKLDILHNLTTSKRLGGPLNYITYAAKKTSMQLADGLLPVDCEPYQTADVARWSCIRPFGKSRLESDNWFWRFQLSSGGSNAIGSSALAPRLPEGTAAPCRTVHILVPFGGTTPFAALARSIHSIANQMYPCKMLWLAADSHQPDDANSEHASLIKAACQASTGVKQPGFATVRGASNEDVQIGCVNISINANKNRGAGYRLLAGFTLLSSFAQPRDVILVVEGGDELIHPQALAITAAAYEYGCWFTWSGARGTNEIIYSAPLPRECIAPGYQARPRRSRFVYSSARSFLAGLLPYINATHFQKVPTGEWASALYDVRWVYRIIELSGLDRSCYLEARLYLYSDERRDTRGDNVLALRDLADQARFEQPSLRLNRSQVREL
eukprot:TRINITY_DN92032_c0_g1_i1.p1 TRINITY_DN92032_c0_g1~~TRINITY_DN92032_c0_g1_i1.p1  ORF type:complete len:708 (+),score=26.87 TRINITY_DN92032_c0_g1_i1:128-2251(+)